MHLGGVTAAPADALELVWMTSVRKMERTGLQHEQPPLSCHLFALIGTSVCLVNGFSPSLLNGLSIPAHAVITPTCLQGEVLQIAIAFKNIQRLKHDHTALLLVELHVSHFILHLSASDRFYVN